MGLIMRRTLGVAWLGLVLGLGLGLVRLQNNVQDELLAAQTLAHLAARLASLSQQPDDQALASLRGWQHEGALRHLSLHLQDAQGHDLLPSPAPAVEEEPASPLQTWVLAWLPAPAPFTVAWAVPRPDGGRWQVALSAHPANEQREAWQFVLESMAVLAGVSLGTLGVLHLNIRRALAPLAVLLEAIGRLRQGRREPLLHLPPMPVAELQSVADALRDLAHALAEAEAQQRHLAQQMISLQDDERHRLAHELHDEFGQHLTALRVDAAWLLRQGSLTPAMRTVVQGMAGQLERIQQDIRALLARLRPLPPEPTTGPSAPPAEADTETPVPELAGVSLAHLGQALAALVQGWQRVPGCPTRFALTLAASTAHGQATPWPASGTGSGACLPDALAHTLYRISQEALTNIARHAQAEQASLTLRWQAAGAGQAARLSWHVEDDGVGLPDLGDALHRGNGLAGLKERIWAQGAELEVAPARPGAPRPGLSLRADWPDVPTLALPERAAPALRAA